MRYKLQKHCGFKSINTVTICEALANELQQAMFWHEKGEESLAWYIEFDWKRESPNYLYFVQHNTRLQIMTRNNASSLGNI